VIDKLRVYDLPSRLLEGSSGKMVESDITFPQIVGLRTAAISESVVPSVKSWLTIIPLPAAARGIYSYGSRGRKYGQQATIHALLRIGAEWHRRHPNGPRIGLGDVSKQGEGVLPPHVFHRSGADV
jgi:hypothetical protein